MPSQFFNDFKRGLMAGEFNLNEAGDDLRFILCMSNNDVGSTPGGARVNLDDVTLDEQDGANYVRQQLTAQIVTVDDVANRSEFSFDPVTWTALGNGARSITGVLCYSFVDGNPANDLLVAYYEFPTSQDPGGSDFRLSAAVDGFLQIIN